MTVDLAVAGGGPAGLCTALAARRLGLSVRVFEPRQAPIDKACGEGLMPAGVAVLGELGVHPDGVPFRGIRYVQGSWSATGDFASGTGLGVRRTVLHAALMEACEAAGVAFSRLPVRDIPQDAQGVTLPEGRARYLAVADGLTSPLRATLGLEVPSRWPARLGLRRHFRTAPWSDRVEVHWSTHSEAYVTPVAADEVDIAVLLPRSRLPQGPIADRFDTLLGDFPALRERLTQPTSSVRGAGPFARATRRRTLGRVLLVGDAAGYLDPITGEGIRLAAECALVLARAVQTGDLASYERAYERITAAYYRWTGLLLRLGSVPLTRRAIVPVASRIPRLMDRIVRVIGD